MSTQWWCMSTRPKTDSKTTKTKTPQRGIWDPIEFTYGPLVIEVRRRVVRDMVARDRIVFALKAGDLVDEHYSYQFARIVVQSVVIGGADRLVLPDVSAPQDEIRAAFEFFMDWDAGLSNLWIAKLNQVDAPPGDREFWPSARLSEDQKKTGQKSA